MAFRDHIQKFGLRLFLVQEPVDSIPSEVKNDLRKFLIERRAYTDSWFFLIRVSIALALIGCLTADAVMSGKGEVLIVLWTTGYIFGALPMHSLRDSPGKAAVVERAEDDARFPVEKTVSGMCHGMPFASSRRLICNRAVEQAIR